MTKKTMTTDQALSVISEVITFCFEIRGNSNNDKTELAWRKQIEAAEDLINQKLLSKEAA